MTFEELWQELGDTPTVHDPITGNSVIDLDFYSYKKGTPIEDIWHYLEEDYGISVADYL